MWLNTYLVIIQNDSDHVLGRLIIRHHYHFVSSTAEKFQFNIFASSISMATSEQLEDIRNDPIYKDILSRSVAFAKNLDVRIKGDKSDGEL